MYEVSSTSNRSRQVEMDNNVHKSEKVEKLLSAVDALTKQINNLNFELREIKNEKKGWQIL